MHTEIEAKFHAIHVDEVRENLKGAGGKLLHPDRLMRRRIFDYPDHRLDRVGAWVRVRDEGHKTTLTYKQTLDRSIEGTKELELIVSDFDTMCAFLAALGLTSKSYQETRREEWILHGVEVVLDTWPWLLPYVEVEGDTEEHVANVSRILGLDWDARLHGSVDSVYQQYYDIELGTLNDIPEMTFTTPVPDWLATKKRTASPSQSLA